MEELPINSRVELIPGMEDVYFNAVAQSKAVVRKRKVDEDGFPMIFVEWDRDDWRYNGERNGWTLESHFRMVDEEAEPPQDEIDASPTANWVVRALEEVADEAKEESEYTQEMESALELLLESNSFMLIVTKRLGHNNEIIVPAVISGSKDQTGHHLLEAQLLQIAAAAFMDKSFGMLDMTKDFPFDQLPPEEE